MAGEQLQVYRIYYHVDGAEKPGTLPPNVSAAVNGVAFCGTLAGQLFFGWLGDKLGRKIYGMTLMLMVICSIASDLSFGHTPKSVMATLCFFRFWLGFGIGGDYPLSATIMSEYANKKTRGAFIAAVYAMQGFGILAGGIFAIIISSAFKARFDAPRYKIPETPRYTALVAKNAKPAASDMSKVLQMDIDAEPQKIEQLEREISKFGLFSKEFSKRHGLHLLGTTTTWFLLDIAFYSQNLFQKDIFSAIPSANTMNTLEEVFRIARAQTLIALCSTVPGYWFTVAFIAEIFPARLRSTCHGISAASGKLGAIVGAFGFLYLAQNKDKAKARCRVPWRYWCEEFTSSIRCSQRLGLLVNFLGARIKRKIFRRDVK
ncbi:hypothetical protein CRYUN_Cryun20dG0084300 [Craigia yunnanensis]